MGFNGLSNKQERFINLHVIDGLNISDAYREAYDTKTSNQNTLYNQASMLASNPKVSLRIKELRENLESKLALKWDKARIVEELAVNVEASRNVNQFSASNRSLELLGKAIGNVFEPETQQVNIAIVETLGRLPDSVLQQLESMTGTEETIEPIGTIETSFKVLESEPD
jgi:hypothetical protein